MQRAVFGNLGAQHVFHAGVDILFQERQQVFRRIFLPAVDADLAVAHVGTKYHAVGTIPLQPRHEQLGLSDGYAADGHHLCAVVEGRLQVVVGLDAATEVYRQPSLRGNTAKHGGVDNVFRLGTVEVNDVQTAIACLLELAGHLQRTAVDGLLGVVTLGQPYTLSVDDVNGGDEFY